MSEMRILTVRQPWAEAIIFGGKDVENRVRNVAGGYRGPVAIHAGLAFDNDWQSAALDDAMRLGRAVAARTGATVPWREHSGAIIGVVDLVDVHRANGDNPGEMNLCAPYGLCSPWAEPKGLHLALANARPLVTPIPFKGALGLRHLDDDTTARIEVQL